MVDQAPLNPKETISVTFQMIYKMNLFSHLSYNRFLVFLLN